MPRDLPPQGPNDDGVSCGATNSMRPEGLNVDLSLLAQYKPNPAISLDLPPVTMPKLDQAEPSDSSNGRSNERKAGHDVLPGPNDALSGRHGVLPGRHDILPELDFLPGQNDWGISRPGYHLPELDLVDSQCVGKPEKFEREPTLGEMKELEEKFKKALQDAGLIEKDPHWFMRR